MTLREFLSASNVEWDIFKIYHSEHAYREESEDEDDFTIHETVRSITDEEMDSPIRLWDIHITVYKNTLMYNLDLLLGDN